VNDESHAGNAKGELHVRSEVALHMKSLLHKK
jgi:hypothetical protein